VSLFDDSRPGGGAAGAGADAPLAARMRPRNLDEVAGQRHLLGTGQAAAPGGRAGPAHLGGPVRPAGLRQVHGRVVIAQHTAAHFESFSAVMGGVAEVRKLIEVARERRKAYNRRTLLFVDEIHRFNKAQQDAFLPHVEGGTILLIGATTENPYFSVNAPLLSRARIYRFEALSEEDIGAVLDRALADKERGLGNEDLVLEPDARAHLVGTANGDARAALNALELAASLTGENADGARTITLAVAEEAVGRRSIGYDKDGDAHYDIISAFIKSLRGSDPDAALYYLARMIEAGEDPRFIARRLVILASEDVGNADPSALPLAVAGFHATELIGLPECAINLAQVTTYLAAAPKSNAAYVGLSRAQEDVRGHPFTGVPAPLRDASYKGAKALGHGKGYRYPHDFPGGFVPQRYLPDGLPSTGTPYYEPTEHGVEAKIKARLERLWAAAAEEGAGNAGPDEAGGASPA
jgi:putative ATPase